MDQIDIFKNNNKKKSIINADLDKCVISEFNPRNIRSTEYIKKLADRMGKNGFEITRALWGYAFNSHYEIFAGGTRLEAAKLAGLKSVPVVLHDGYDENDFVRLADEDNENDEYHAKVSIVDDWLFCKKLHDKGWTQERIAQVKGISQRSVSYKLFYANFPKSILNIFSTNENLNEGQARELLNLAQCAKIQDWLKTETALLEIIDNILKRTTKPTADHFKKEVEKYNKLIKEAESLFDSLFDDVYQKRFVNDLSKNKARTLSAIRSIYNRWIDKKALEAQIKEKEAQDEQAQLLIEQTINKRYEIIRSKLIFDDALSVEYPDNIKLLFTDPPYGMDFQSNRRVVSAKSDKIDNDNEQAFELLDKVLAKIYPKMQENSTALIWSGKQYLREFMNIIEKYFDSVTFLIWNKPNHGSGDLQGDFAPKFECIIHAKKGNPKLNKRLDDVLDGDKFLKTEHPTEKPIDLIQKLIEVTTDEGELVVDSFAGTGSVPLTAYKLNRDIFAVEIKKDYYDVMGDLLYSEIKQSIMNE